MFAGEFQAIQRRLWLIAAGVVGNAGDADDIVQESAIVAFRRIQEFTPGTSFSAWVAEIVRRKAFNFRRKTARRKTFTTDPTELDRQRNRDRQASLNIANSIGTIDAEVDDDMFRVLNQLPDEARCCLLLRVIDELSYGEISELLQIPAGTAMSHVHRSKAFARQRMRRDSSAGGAK